MAIVQPDNNGLRINIGKNDLLQETTSEKLKNIGTGLQGLGAGFNYIQQGRKHQTFLKNLQPAAQFLATKMGVDIPSAMEMLLNGDVTPQGLAGADKTRFEMGGEAAAGKKLLGFIQNTLNSANAIGDVGNPQSLTQPVNPNGVPVGTASTIGPTGATPGYQEPKPLPLGTTVAGGVTENAGLDFGDVSDAEAAALLRNISGISSLSNARTMQGKSGAEAVDKALNVPVNLNNNILEGENKEKDLIVKDSMIGKNKASTSASLSQAAKNNAYVKADIPNKQAALLQARTANTLAGKAGGGKNPSAKKLSGTDVDLELMRGGVDVDLALKKGMISQQQANAIRDIIRRGGSLQDAYSTLSEILQNGGNFDDYAQAVQDSDSDDGLSGLDNLDGF